MIISVTELEEILRLHKLWLQHKAGGKRAILDNASLDGASLNGASLDRASLNGASLNGASLDRASLNGASLDRASLNRASLNDASLDGASLSQTTGILSPSDYLAANFEAGPDGYFAYKTFGTIYYPPASWTIQPGSVISEVVAPCPVNDCGSGINVAPLKWVKTHYKGEIWKVLIRWAWLPGVVVPYHTDGKIRCERVELVEVVTN